MEVGKRFNRKIFWRAFPPFNEDIVKFSSNHQINIHCSYEPSDFKYYYPFNDLDVDPSSFIFLDTGQSLQSCPWLFFQERLMGSFLSGSILKNIPIKMIAYFEEIMHLCILFSWLTNQFLLLLAVVFLCAVL